MKTVAFDSMIFIYLFKAHPTYLPWAWGLLEQIEKKG